VTTEVTFKTLSADIVRCNLAAFIAVASDIPGEYWAAENFLAERPEKWRFSYYACRDDELAGYAILSRKAESCVHLHHFMVARAHRNQGLGDRMVGEFLSRCQAAHVGSVTLKTQRTNSGAIRFYDRFGFKKIACEGEYIVMAKLLDGRAS